MVLVNVAVQQRRSMSYPRSMAEVVPQPARASVRPAAAVSDRPPQPAARANVRCAVRGVAKRYGTQPVLRGVDLTIPEGAFAVLVGPSGCGKSTLLRLVAGLEQADEGAVELGGRDVT